MEPIKNAKMWLPHAWRRQKYEHDWAMHKYGMHGGWHTRIRLASARQGELGKWERVEHYPYPATARLARHNEHLEALANMNRLRRIVR